MPNARPAPECRVRLAARLLGALLAGLVTTAPAAAETLYVTDRIEVGLHESRDRGSVITALIPSATRLEVLERDGGFIRVRTPEGAEGWADAAYLTANLPAQQVVNELEQWKQTREEELKAAWAEVETLRNQLAAQAGETETPADTAPREDYRKAAERVAALESENAALRDLLEKQAQAVAAAPPPAPRDPPVIGGWTIPEWLPQAALVAAGVLFVFGIMAGVWLMDRLNRRRHGGFRV